MSNTVVSEFIAVRWSNFINNYVTAGFVYSSVWVVVLLLSLSLSHMNYSPYYNMLTCYFHFLITLREI